MIINAKPFKNWEEQVEILNKWGNNFLEKNPNDRPKVLSYLMKYNFQVAVDSFAPLLWTNFEDGMKGKNLNFISNFQFNDLIELFNFDNYLKNLINKELQELEKRLRTAIIYYTLEQLNLIYDGNINLPFILIDDNWSPIIASSLFTNHFSKQSFFNDNQFQYNDYYSFLQKYIEPFDLGSLFVKNADLKKFYFSKVLYNRQELQTYRKSFSRQYNSENCDEKLLGNDFLEIQDLDNKKISCSFNHFLKWCKTVKKIPDKFSTNEKYIENSTIDATINALAKSFVPIYKLFTQESFGDMIKFFCKLNEKIQIKIIKEEFPNFYHYVYSNSEGTQNIDLILIGTFISLLNLFKNLRNKIAHLDIIYNFWDISIPSISILARNINVKDNQFWIANQDTCQFLTRVCANWKKDFLTNYFTKWLINKSPDQYLNQINNLGVKVFCKYKLGNISFIEKNDDKDCWHLPLFFLKDSVDWLCIFTDNNKNFSLIIDDCLKNNKISKDEIKNRLYDYLFCRIIISLDKIDGNEYF